MLLVLRLLTKDSKILMTKFYNYLLNIQIGISNLRVRTIIYCCAEYFLHGLHIEHLYIHVHWDSFIGMFGTELYFMNGFML